MRLTKDDGNTVYLEFFDSTDPLRNRFQVTQQVTMQGGCKDRYDATILVRKPTATEIGRCATIRIRSTNRDGAIPAGELPLEGRRYNCSLKR